MKTVGAFEAKTHFSALLEAAEHGETIIVTKKGRPVAQIAPLPDTKAKQTPEQAMKQLLSMKPRLRGVEIRELVEEGRRR